MGMLRRLRQLERIYQPGLASSARVESKIRQLEIEVLRLSNELDSNHASGIHFAKPRTHPSVQGTFARVVRALLTTWSAHGIAIAWLKSHRIRLKRDACISPSLDPLSEQEELVRQLSTKLEELSEDGILDVDDLVGFNDPSPVWI